MNEKNDLLDFIGSIQDAARKSRMPQQLVLDIYKYCPAPAATVLDIATQEQLAWLRD